MKNFKSLVVLFLIATVSLVSCNKDDDAPAETSIEGKWQFSKEGISNGGQEVLSNYQHTAGCTKDYVEFLSAGVYKEYYYSTSSCTPNIETGTWSRNGSSITTTIAGNAVTDQIVELSGSSLKTSVVFESTNFITLYTKI